MTSSCAVSAFIATRKSISFLRAMYPSLLARIVNHVGRPAIFDGNRFFPETGTPIWKMLRSRTVLELCEPDPFTVATWMLMSLTTRFCPGWPDDCRGTTSVVAIPVPSPCFDRATPPPGFLAEWRVKTLYYTASIFWRVNQRNILGGRFST